MEVPRLMNQKIRCYSELILIPSFEERFEYLVLGGSVGEATFGFDRYLNQIFYQSPEWREVRDYVILRDGGCDLGIPDREIHSKIIIHHMNPITKNQILDRNPIIFDPEFLITTYQRTHNAIHYGDRSILYQGPVERTPNDTCPWKQ